MSYPTNPPWVPSCASTGAGVEVPDATATPRTRAVQNECAKLGADYGKWYGYVCAELEQMERELTEAKAEIADLKTCLHNEYERAEKYLGERNRAEAALRERTQWQCKCGGTDCAGQTENERLKASVGELEADKARLIEAAYACVTQLEHVEKLRSMDCGPIPATLSAEVIKETRAALDAVRAGKGAT